MNNHLNKIMNKIGHTFKDDIANDSRHYLEVDIGKYAEKSGYSSISHEFRSVNALVPLRHPVSGMKVRIDGRTFINYAQFDSGVAVPGYVAEKTALAHKPYQVKDSMILNFT
jgi:hypothetical protein